MNVTRTTALSYSKHRNEFGMVGIDVDNEKKLSYTKMALRWPREKMNIIPKKIASLYGKLHWNGMYVDQQ